MFKKKLRSIEALVKDSWQIYIKNWAFLIKVTLTSYALMIALALGFIPAVAPAVGIIFAKQKTIFIVLSVAFFLIWTVLLFILGFWTQTALYQSIWQAAQKKPTTVKENFRIAWKKWPKFLTTSLLSGLLTLLGILFLIIPGIILAVWFSLFRFVVIAEEKSGLTALKKSCQLVKGHFWGVLGRLLLITFFSFLVAAFPHRTPLISIITNFLLSPLFLLMSLSLYKDLT